MPPSFFNLEIELLLEGLPGAYECDTYKFHIERGYGDSYYKQVRIGAYESNQSFDMITLLVFEGSIGASQGCVFGEN